MLRHPGWRLSSNASLPIVASSRNARAAARRTVDSLAGADRDAHFNPRLLSQPLASTHLAPPFFTPSYLQPGLKGECDPGQQEEHRQQLRRPRNDKQPEYTNDKNYAPDLPALFSAGIFVAVVGTTETNRCTFRDRVTGKRTRRPVCCRGCSQSRSGGRRRGNVWGTTLRTARRLVGDTVTAFNARN